MDSVMRIVKEVKASEIKQKFDQQPIIQFRVRKTHKKKVTDKLDSLQINYKIDNEYWWNYLKNYAQFMRRQAMKSKWKNSLLIT